MGNSSYFRLVMIIRQSIYIISIITREMGKLKTYSPTYCTLRWRHNDQAGVSNHQPYGCLLNRLFRRRSKETSKLRVTGLCAVNSPGPVNSPHKGPVTRKMFPFDDVIMIMDNVENMLNLTHTLDKIYLTYMWDWDWEKLLNTTYQYTVPWYPTHTLYLLMALSGTNLISVNDLYVGRNLLRPSLASTSRNIRYAIPH